MNFLFHNLKNHINRDPLCDWLDKMHKISKVFKKDKPNIFQIEIDSQKVKYKLKFISFFKDEPFYYENINHKQIIDLINDKKECIIVCGNLHNNNFDITVKPDIIIHRSLFKKYFPQVTMELPEYIIIDILYKNIHYNASKTDILNEGSIYYHKCKMFISSDALGISDYGYFFGKEYRHKGKVLSKKELIGRFPLKRELRNSVIDALNWLKKLNKCYDEWSIYPKPCIKELYPNMNHKHIFWTDEKTTLANLIKEITLVWNISYNKRCILLDKDIYQWDDPFLLSNVYNYTVKDNYRFHIQDKMIHLQLQDDIKIEPRKIKNYDFINVIKNNENSIILDIESVCDYNEKEDYFDTVYSKDTAKICIIGTILNDNNIFKDFTIRYLKYEEERIIICHWLTYLENNLDVTKKIKVYHWGNAEKVYLKYMKQKYFDLKFPDFEMIDLLTHFKNEPIVIKGCFGYGLKEIVKCLYDQKLIKNKWKDDMNGLDAMIKLKQYSDKAISKNIPIKRFSEVKDIIYYNYIDCRVITDILQLLLTMV
jgi:hypothetical protein